MVLTESQKAAIKYFEKIAISKKEMALGTIHHILKMSNVSEKKNALALKNLKDLSRVALHFHPDRPLDNQITVIESLLQTGVYKSQFETSISNGGVSAHPGGDRDLWEKEIYGGSYHQNGFIKEARPKYGALNIFDFPDGPAPRFGSCYFILNHDILNRATFTYMDSHQIPEERGTLKEFDYIYSELLTEIFTRNFALGEKDLTISKFIDVLCNRKQLSFKNFDKKPVRRNLNHYIEAQVHGDILLNEHIEVLVADSSFKNDIVGEKTIQISKKYEFDIYWHSGFRLNVDKVPLDFRGPEMPSLAKRVSCGKPFFNTRMIGEAARSLKKNPNEWKDRGSFDEVLQELKLLWHVLVTYGDPIEEG